MLSSARCFGSTLAIASALVGSAAAQSAQKASLQVSLLGASLSGEEFTGWGTGTGFEAQVRYNPSAFSIGGGFQLTKHSLEDFTEKVSLGGVFVEPRYVIPTKSNKAAPYLAARVSILRESGSFDATAGKVDVSASGLTLNGGGGVLIRLARTLNLDLGLTFGRTNFGTPTVKLNGQTVAIPELEGKRSGSSVIFRAGIAVGLGK